MLRSQHASNIYVIKEHWWDKTNSRNKDWGKKLEAERECFEGKLQHVSFPSQRGHPWHYFVAFTFCCEKCNKQLGQKWIGEDAKVCRHGDHYSSEEQERRFFHLLLHGREGSGWERRQPEHMKLLLLGQENVSKRELRNSVVARRVLKRKIWQDSVMV